MKVYGLFVWHSDPRYYGDTALKIYKRQTDAERAARKMNDAGMHGGMVVVRETDSEAAIRICGKCGDDQHRGPCYGGE